MDQSHVTMAVFLVAERNRAEGHAAEHSDLLQVAAYHRGMRDALNLAIAWVGGLEGFLSRQSFEAALATAGHVRPEAAAATGPDDDEDDDEPAAAPVTACERGVHYPSCPHYEAMLRREASRWLAGGSR